MYILKNIFLSQPQFAHYKRYANYLLKVNETLIMSTSRYSFQFHIPVCCIVKKLISSDILFDSAGNFLEVSRILVQLRHIGASNQSRAMQVLRNIAKSRTIKTAVYADFFQVILKKCFN